MNSLLYINIKKVPANLIYVSRKLGIVYIFSILTVVFSRKETEAGNLKSYSVAILWIKKIFVSIELMGK